MANDDSNRRQSIANAFGTDEDGDRGEGRTGSDGGGGRSLFAFDDDPDERPLAFARRVTDRLASRRAFLSNAATVGGAALGLSAAGTATAVDDDDGEGAGGSDGESGPTDLEILNFALLLERLEATFYEEAIGDAPLGSNEAGGGVFTQREIENSEVGRQFSSEPTYRWGIYEQFQRIRDHERAHVEALVEAIENAGGDPVGNPGFTFPYDTVPEFVELARTFEDLGASAYAGAAPLISNPAYVGPAARILAIEARHAGYLRFITLKHYTPFPNAFQRTRSMSEVERAAEPFIGDGGD